MQKYNYIEFFEFSKFSDNFKKFTKFSENIQTIVKRGFLHNFWILWLFTLACILPRFLPFVVFSTSEKKYTIDRFCVFSFYTRFCDFVYFATAV